MLASIVGSGLRIEKKHCSVMRCVVLHVKPGLGRYGEKGEECRCSAMQLHAICDDGLESRQNPAFVFLKGLAKFQGDQLLYG